MITVRSVTSVTHHIIMSSSYSSSYWVQHFTHLKEHWKLFTVKASWYWVKLAHSCFEDQHFYGRLHTHYSLLLIAGKVANAVKWVLYFQGGHVSWNILTKIITLWFIWHFFLINRLVQNNYCLHVWPHPLCCRRNKIHVDVEDSKEIHIPAVPEATYMCAVRGLCWPKTPWR